MRTATVIASALLLFAAPAAWGAHREDRADARIRALAHDLERAARHVHREAERRQHHYGWAEEAALADLHRLEERATHFHRQVERSRRDPYHAARDYQELRYAYLRAAESLHDLHAFDHVERDFDRVSILIRELDAYFGPRYGHDRDWRRHDRYDRHRRLPRVFFELWWRR